MAKEIETTNDAGEVIKETVYTKEEYEARDTEVTTLKAELEDVKKINAERSQNFTAYSKMTDEEKKVYDANTINLLKREEALVNQVNDLSTKLNDKDKRESESAKNNALAAIHHNDEASKTLLEEKYKLLSGMPETTPAEISARAQEAAKLAGIQIDPRNPLYTPITGEAPNYNPNKEYVDTPAGKQALDMARAALGITPDKK